MSIEVLTGEDVVARCLIYPQFFEGSVHVNGKLWEFGKRSEDGASHQSAVLRRLASNDDEVHRIGCKIAQAGNDRFTDGPPPEKQRYYCGFRDALVSDLPLAGDKYRIVLQQQEEFGERAHVDVALFIDADVSRNKQANMRTSIGLALAEKFGGAKEHVCECDREDANHPFTRIGPTCISAGLRGPWQGEAVHLSDLPVQAQIEHGEGWPGLSVTKPTE